MKPLKRFLHAIHALPEEVRRFLAAFSFMIAAATLFTGWNILIPARLASISSETINPAASINFQNPEDAQPKQEALSPLEGIGESFKSLQSIIGPRNISEPSPWGTPEGSGKSGLASITTFLETAWRYVYDPLR